MSNNSSNFIGGNTKTHVFESSNMIVILANIIFFMVVQTLFFKYVASRQFNIVLEDKANIVEEYLKHDPKANTKFREFKNSDRAKEIKKAANEQEKIREAENMSNTMTWIGIPLLIVVSFLIFFIGKLFFKKEEWDTTDSILLSFVVFAYMIEVLFYLGIVRQYQFYGDQAIYDNLYRKINESVNKYPATIKGRELDNTLDDTVMTYMKNSNNINDVKTYYDANKSKFGGMDLNTFTALVKTNTANVDIVDSVNFDALKQIEGKKY
jgi:hypothetical protein